MEKNLLNLIPNVASGNEKYADLFRTGKNISKKDNSLSSIYIVGANFYGVGLLNTVHVLLAYVAKSSLPKNTKFTILDPGRCDYVDLIGSPFLNGEIITSENDILTILENASEITFDFTNVIILNHYDWLKNNFDVDISKRATLALNKLVDCARERNIIIIVVDRGASLHETLPNYDAILCFHLASEYLSKHILGVSGAEKLKDKGDSLYLNKKTGEVRHGQIPLLSEDLFKTVLEIPSGT